MDYNNPDYCRPLMDVKEIFDGEISVPQFSNESFSMYHALLQGMKIIDVWYETASLDKTNHEFAETVCMLLISPTNRLFTLSIAPNIHESCDLNVHLNEAVLCGD